ncbi:unnamed protein product, partial [Choristocarpus tenellus]
LEWDPCLLDPPRPDVVTMGMVIDGCSRAGDAEAALALLKKMEQVPALPSPNIHCITSAITACGKGGKPDWGADILRRA